MAWIMMRLLVLLSSLLLLDFFLLWMCNMVGNWGNWMSVMPFSMAFLRKRSIWLSLKVMLILLFLDMSTFFIRLFMVSNRPLGLGLRGLLFSCFMLGSVLQLLMVICSSWGISLSLCICHSMSMILSSQITVLLLFIVSSSC